MQLAERSGRLDVDRMLDEIDSAQLTEWMAYNRLKDPEYLETVKQSRMTDDERAAQIRKMLGG